MRGRALLLKFVKMLVVLALFGVAAVGAASAWVYVSLLPELPSIEHLQDVRLQVPLRVYARDGSLIAEFGEKRRQPLAIDETPETLVNAFLSSEDDRFYEHPGVDYQGILRAALSLAATGRKEQGGSTITMQVARNFFLTPEKTYIRKIKEILLALQIEQQLSKPEILELYLNKIYLGNRSYGVGAAAQIYYSKTVGELTLAESAMIAGLPKAPSRFNPLANPERARIRRDYVLDRMHVLGFISDAEHAEARGAQLTAKRYLAQTEVDAQYVAEMVRSEIIDRFGEEESYTGGYKVYTTLDPKMQQAANVAVRNGLFGYEERHGYRGPVAKAVTPPPGEDGEPVLQLDETLRAEAVAALTGYPDYEPAYPATVIEVNDAEATLANREGETRTLTLKQLEWARRRQEDSDKLGPKPATMSDVLVPGDLVYLVDITGGARLVQIPDVEGALTALDPDTGAVRALVGGFSFERSKFNRATQALRQPGSNFKPFVYSAALEQGFTAASLVNDAPVVFDDPALEDVWRPENYSGKFFGPTRLREALVKSRNLVSVRVLISLGVSRALKYSERFGFRRASLPRDLSLVLGSANVSPFELARGYAVFANGGYLVNPYFIERIEDGEGETVFEAEHLTVCRDCELPQEGENGQPTENGAVLSAEPNVDSDAVAPLLHPAPRIIEERNVFIMRSILGDVIRFGTARRARALKRKDLAGKTGTTNDQVDAWFSGFNSSLVATAWVGFDSQASLGARETGGRAALPIWIDFMRTALDGVPEDKVSRPDGLVTALIDRKTGEVTGADNPERMFEIFREEFAPELQRTTAVSAKVPRSSSSGSGGGGKQADSSSDDSPEQLF